MDGAENQGLWLYRDRQGEEHLVTTQQIPAEYKDRAVRVGAAPLEGVGDAAHGQNALEQAVSVLSPSANGVNTHSFLLGFGAATALVMAVLLARFTPRWMFRLVIMGVLAAVVGIGYLTFVRHQAGLAGVGTPGSMIEDARKAVDMANQAMEQRQKVIDRIDSIEAIEPGQLQGVGELNARDR